MKKYSLLIGFAFFLVENCTSQDLHFSNIQTMNQQVFPEFVSENKTNDGNPLVSNQLGIDYAGLSAVAIKAIQEQQVIIESQKKEIDAQKAEANKAAQSSAVSYPLPKIKAIEIPINAIIEVIASLLWCQASAFNEELLVSLLFLNTNR